MSDKVTFMVTVAYEPMTKAPQATDVNKALTQQTASPGYLSLFEGFRIHVVQTERVVQVS